MYDFLLVWHYKDSAILTTCTIFELYAVEEYRDFEIEIRVTQDH